MKKKNTKKFGFGTKLLVMLSLVITICLGIMISVNSYLNYTSSEKAAQKYIAEMAENHAGEIKLSLDEGILLSKQIANRFEYLLKNNKKISREETISYLKSTIKNAKDLQGVWLGLKKTNLFPMKQGSDSKAVRSVYDKFGVFNPYIQRTEDGSIVAIPGSGYSMDFKWIKGTYETKKPYITKPVLHKGTNTLIVGIAVPVFVDNEYYGATGAVFALTGLSELVKDLKIYDTGYAYVTDKYCNILAHRKTAIINKNILDFPDYAKDENVKNFCKKVKIGEDFSFSRESTSNGLKSFFYSHTFKAGDSNQSWAFVVGAPESEYLADAQFSLNLSVISGLITLVIIILILLYVTKMLNTNLKLISTGLSDFFSFLNKQSDTTSKIEIKSQDEFGEMANEINLNIEKIKQNVNEESSLIEDVKLVVNSVSEGLFYKRVEAKAQSETMNELKELLNNMLETLQLLVGKDLNEAKNVLSEYSKSNFVPKLSKNSGIMGEQLNSLNEKITQMLQANQSGGLLLEDNSRKLTDNIQTLSSNATSQAASLEQTAASIEEVTSNIQNTSGKAQEMFNISSETEDSASKGKDLATQTVTSMDEINEQVSSINEAITVIDQIAFQTNILSLNAAVEAATAGEAGKGFAVVAQEVRNLASRSAEAAKEIKDLVETATQKANIGKEISSSMIEGFAKLEEKILQTNELINDVSSSSKEQSLTMTQIADAINQLDKFTQENASIADKTNAIANETYSVATEFVAQANKNKFDGKK